MSKTEHKTPLKEAKAIANAFLKNHFLDRPILVGSIGRGELLVGDIDIMAFNKSRLGERDDTTFDGMKVNVWYTDDVHKESMKLFLDGPKSENIARAGRARNAGYKYNMYGLWKDDVRVANDKISIEKMIHETDGIGEETLTGEFIKFAKLTNPSGNYLQVGTIRIEEDKEGYKVISVFELWSGSSVIKRYEKVKCEGRTMDDAENMFNKWIKEKTAKGYKLVA